MSLEDEERVAALRATAHPLRLQMLSLLTGADLSAAELARELDVTQANASYHLRVLLNAGLLVIAGEESVRGGRAKKYRHPWDRQDRQDRQGRRGGWGDEASRQAFIAVLAQALQARYRHREPGVPGQITDAELWVAPEVWDEVLELVTRASGLVHENAQPPRAPGTIRTNLTIGAFTMRPGEG